METLPAFYNQGMDTKHKQITRKPFRPRREWIDKSKIPTMKPLSRNTLFYGDNLEILREYVPDESVDLIYLDPPFNSNRSYNVLFKEESGKDSESQITAFEDTWHWGEDAQRTYHDLVQDAPANVSTMISMDKKHPILLQRWGIL